MELNSWLIQISKGLEAKQNQIKIQKEELEKLKELEVINKQKKEVEAVKTKKLESNQEKDDKSKPVKEEKANIQLESETKEKPIVKKKKKKGQDIDIKLGCFTATKEQREYSEYTVK